ncbi:hypothetical protein M2140_000756 [Clostridiales Family XIII bacterium PM5-7]
MNKKLIFALTMVLLLMMIPLSSAQASAKSSQLLNYHISVTTSGQGELYWTHGKNMEFFLCNGNDSYNQNCLIKNGKDYTFSRLIERGIVPKPSDDWYFDGFYNRSGGKLNPDVYNIDILRVTVDGLYYYDYVLSLDNAKYKHYSKKKYEDTVKAYLKTAYGTTRYKKLFTTKLYQFQNKTVDVYGKFKPKQPVKLKQIGDLRKNIGDDVFLIPSPNSSIKELTYKSSNRNVISIKKGTDIATIKGQGKTTITVSIPETETTLATVSKFVIRVYPLKMNLISASASTKSYTFKWKSDLNSSGYELQYSPNANMTNFAKKSITSAKASTTKITATKKIRYTYARIRSYKKSGGETLYSPWSNIIKIKAQ